MDNSDDIDRRTRSPRNRKDKKNGRKQGDGYKGEQRPSPGGTAHRSKKNQPPSLPPCLNQKCAAKGGRHYMSDCTITDEAEKEKLIMEYRLEKKRRKERFSNSAGNSQAKRGAISAVKSRKNNDSTTNPALENSALFSAAFCNGGVEFKVSTDHSSDVNLVPLEIFDSIKSSNPELATREVAPPVKFNSVAVGGVVTCHRSLKADITLRIRHGTTLILREAEWWLGTSQTTTQLSAARYWTHSDAATRK